MVQTYTEKVKLQTLIHNQTGTLSCSHTSTSASSVCPWVCVSFVWLPSVTSHRSFFSPPDTPLGAPECQTGQTEWVHAPVCACVCVSGRCCDYSLCYVLLLWLQSFSLSPSLPHTLSVYVTAAVAHWGLSVPTGQPDGVTDLWCGMD